MHIFEKLINVVTQVKLQTEEILSNSHTNYKDIFLNVQEAIPQVW